MAEFINTIDALGDDAVVDGIIQRTITEFKDNQIKALGEYAFNGCNALTYLEFPEVTSVPFYGFTGITNVETIIIPKATYAFFEGLKKLKTVVLPENYSGSTSKLFSNCESIERVNLPNVDRLQQYFCLGCKSLIEVNVPKVNRVELAAFQNCSAIEQIDLPSCTSINGFNQFSGCSKLKALILRNTAAVCTLNLQNTFPGTPIQNGTGYIYVPKALLSDDDETKDYRRATNWATYAAQFRALEDYTVDGTITGELDETKI